MRSYPLLKGKITEYGDPECPICGSIISRSKGYARVGMGSILYNKASDGGGPHSSMRMYWYMSYLGPYTLLKAGPYSTLNIAESLMGGQATFFFCSIKCLRVFFNKLVDDLEKKFRQRNKTVIQKKKGEKRRKV